MISDFSGNDSGSALSLPGDEFRLRRQRRRSGCCRFGGFAGSATTSTPRGWRGRGGPEAAATWLSPAPASETTPGRDLSHSPDKHNSLYSLSFSSRYPLHVRLLSPSRLASGSIRRTGTKKLLQNPWKFLRVLRRVYIIKKNYPVFLAHEFSMLKNTHDPNFTKIWLKDVL